LARVAEAFVEDGHTVDLIRCDGAFSSHCVAMSAANTSFNSSQIKKDLVCRACRKRANIIDSGSSSNPLLFENFLQTGDLKVAKDLASSVDKDNWSSCTYKQIPVGAIAAYEILLTHKLDSLRIPDAIWSEYIANLINTVLVVIVGERILKSTQPDRVLVYNSLYSLNNAYVQVAESMGISTFTLQGGPHISRRPSTLTTYSSPKEMFNTTYSQEASDWLSHPIDIESIKIVSEHLQKLLSGESAFAYSSASRQNSGDYIPSRLRLDPEKPTLVALLSSEDEFFAANLENAIPRILGWKSVFKDQTSWLRWLIDFAQRHGDLILVIRVHPRMLPNKRESVVAPYLSELEKLFSNLPDNVRVNLPSDNISIYDLMQFTDLVLNKRSSAGLEMLAYGLPVVLPGDENLFSCPPEICSVATDEDSYENLILMGLKEGWSLERVRVAYRWFAFTFRATTVDIMPINKSNIAKIRPKRSRTMLALWKGITFIYLQFGPMRSENNAIVEIRSNLPEIDSLIQTVTTKREGIFSIRTRQTFPSATVDEETVNLLVDLNLRIETLSKGAENDTPLVARIKFGMSKIS